MTVLIKYPAQSKKRTEEWFKKMKAKDINWAQWGGWFDSDGCFASYYSKKEKKIKYSVSIKLKDRDPVEFFSKTFETSLCYREFNTTVPDGRKYRAKVYVSELRGERAFWFADKIKKYILNKTNELEPFLTKQNIKYIPYSEQWNIDEWHAYIATLIEGDGSVVPSAKVIDVNSINKFLLNYIKIEFKKLNDFDFTGPYQTSKWLNKEKTVARKNPKYDIRAGVTNKIKLKEFIESILPHMTMDRKRQKALIMLDWVNTKI